MLQADLNKYKRKTGAHGSQAAFILIDVKIVKYVFEKFFLKSFGVFIYIIDSL